MKVDAVIGSSFGDEGKGTITARLAFESKKEDKKVLNVLTNGGAQRGHSVTLATGTQIINKHFGSGTYFGADNYFYKTFILNPMQFVKEGGQAQCFIHPECIFTTPFDIMANQIIERKRNAGTCGMGIWQTITRYKDCPFSTTFKHFIESETFEKIQLLKGIREWYERDLTIPKDYSEAWHSDGIIMHFIEDCKTMSLKCKFGLSPKEMHSFDHVILENGQGLLLNDEGKDDKDATPSKTGMDIINDFCLTYNLQNPNIHYVTRPYITRHGAKSRDFLGKTKLENIGIDFTGDREINKGGEFQGNFEYGNLDIRELYKRVVNDFNKSVIKGSKMILDVTHHDQMPRDWKGFENVNYWTNPVVGE